MNYIIKKLEACNYHKCGNIWDMQKNSDMTKRWYQEIISGNRVIFVYAINDEYVGEISLVFENSDSDYTVPKQRIYVSRLVVKDTYRNQGIGTTLVEYACKYAADMGYKQASIGVDWDNWYAIKLYQKQGFDKIIYAGEDEHGRYYKLLKEI